MDKIVRLMLGILFLFKQGTFAQTTASMTFDDATSQAFSVVATPASDYPFTMAAWFSTDDVTIDQAIMSIADNTGAPQDHWSLRIDGTATDDPVIAAARDNNQAEEQAVTTTGSTVNTWHHAAGVYVSATDRSAFIDGGSEGNNTTSKTPAGLAETGVGHLAVQSSLFFFSGSIAHAAIWDVALTNAEVLSLADGENPQCVRVESLVAYWPMIDPSGTGQNDISVNGNDLAGENNPTINSDGPPVNYTCGSQQ